MFADLPSPVIFGHRGYSAAAPENTLSAFRLLIEKGIPAAELDVRICGTGEIVVFHDTNTHRICGESFDIAKTSLETLKQLDAGSHKSLTYRGEKVPTLREVLSEFAADLFFDIEIKEDYLPDRRLHASLADLIEEYSIEKRCIVSSFNPFSLRMFRKYMPQIPRAIIYSDSENVPFWLRNGFGRHIGKASILKPHYKKLFESCDEKNIEIEPAFLNNVTTIPWTVNDKKIAEALKKNGAAGIISDDPEIIC